MPEISGTDMPKKTPELSAAQVKRLTHGTVKGDPKVDEKRRKRAIGEPCVAYHPVGGVPGLLLQCRPPRPDQKEGARSWILRVQVGAKRRDIGLGGYPAVTLAEAREAAREVRKQISQGVDPVAERKAARSALIAAQGQQLTFSHYADIYARKKAAEFGGRNPAKQRQKLDGHLGYILPKLGKMLMQDITRAHVVDVLMQPDEKTGEPIWHCKHETASRVRLHMERIYGIAKAEGIVNANNPAAWKDNLDQTLAQPDKVNRTEHRPTIGYERLPRFIELLLKRDTFASRAVEFQILTAARPGEVQYAEWSEIDLDAKVWTVPGHKIKNRKDHTKHHMVPLCDRAVEILKGIPRLGDYVFPGGAGKPFLSENALNQTVKAIHKIDVDAGGKGFIDSNFNKVATAHGMRSCFKDFATEETHFEEVVSELALSHLDTSGTKAAYKRKQLIDKRRDLMRIYERYAYTGKLPSHNKVTAIAGGAA